MKRGKLHTYSFKKLKKIIKNKQTKKTLGRAWDAIKAEEFCLPPQSHIRTEKKAHAYCISTGEVGQKDQKFKIILSHIKSSRPAWTVWDKGGAMGGVRCREQSTSWTALCFMQPKLVFHWHGNIWRDLEMIPGPKAALANRSVTQSRVV